MSGRGKGSTTVEAVICITIFSLIIFQGCATKEAVKERRPDDEVLRQRVAAYWNHRVKQELDMSYRLEYPLYQKQVTLVQYVKQQANPVITYNSFEILNIVRTEEESASVKVKVNQTLKVPGAKPLVADTIMEEQWVKVDDVWYHLFNGKGFTQEREKGGDVQTR